MATPTGSVQRRTLRPLNPTTLVEGVLTRSGPDDEVIVRIHGGPPHKTAVVAVDGAIPRGIRLNGCGAGWTRLAEVDGSPRVQVAVDDDVLLTGRLFARPNRSGVRP